MLTYKEKLFCVYCGSITRATHHVVTDHHTQHAACNARNNVRARIEIRPPKKVVLIIVKINFMSIKSRIFAVQTNSI